MGLRKALCVFSVCTAALLGCGTAGHIPSKAIAPISAYDRENLPAAADQLSWTTEEKWWDTGT
ncbi:hypothetical protein V8Z80_19025 [Orrella sp. JC864]|uniref:hypothetical protein n=1 Tax=Orrella sp. JC864 TaxID=3120298 RepID=UPI003009D47E